MSDVSGGLPGVAGVTYTFDDDALASLPPGANAGSGTYKPTNDGAGDTFPFPAPAGPYGATLSGVTGLSPNGLWNLWVVDDAGGDVGSIAGGWTLTLRTQLVSYGGCSFSLFTIPAGAPGTTSGAADVYPSGIIEFLVPVDMDQYKVTIDLLGVTHTYPLDLDVLLVGPQGQKVLLMSDAGGQAPGVNNVNLSFDDDAASGIAQFVNPTAGTYRPTDFEAGDVFPGPAPAGPYATSLSAFKGTNPLGGWALYVVDDATSDVGSMTGWCLNFVPSIDAGEVPNLRFTDKVTLVWDAGPNATSYVLYRGTAAQLPALADHGVDSCQRGLTLTQQFTGVAESPAPGALLWYLVRGDNAQGQGSAGFERFGAQVLARIEDSSGSCP
jgi:subtilisin-like proprotein convertase family protein